MGDFWRETQELLQSGDSPLVKKPKLTENLLKKPPFRFLHDVISEVQRNTGFAPGLLSEHETSSANIKDKESKVAYLNKMVAVVAAANNAEPAARPLKIVAGLEPECTNAFLQQLAHAARRGPCQSAVRAVVGGNDPQEEEEEEEAILMPPAEEPSPSDFERPDVLLDGGRGGEDVLLSQTSPEGTNGNSEMLTLAQPDDAQMLSNQELGMPPPLSKSNPNVLEQQRHEEEEEGPPIPAPVPRLARPSSARRGPPKLPSAKQPAAAVPTRRERSNSISSSSSSSSRDGKVVGRDRGQEREAPVPSENRRKSIILNNAPFDNESDEDGEASVTVVLPSAEGPSKQGGLPGGHEGKLVQDILETRDVLEQAGSAAMPSESGEKSTGIILGRGRKKKAPEEAVSKKAEVLKLREDIQNLCQQTAPLAKYLDFIQEDVDNMNKELHHWVTERRLNGKMAGDATGANGSGGAQEHEVDLQFKGIVKELDMDIERQKEQIHAIKSQILRNDSKIESLLHMVVSRG